MNVTDEELMALADGELSGADEARVSAAVAADPALSARLEAERSLRAVLRGHLDPVLDEPVPESLTLMIAAAAAEEAEAEMTDATVHEPAPVLDFAAARARRDAEAKAARAAVQVPAFRRWGAGAAIAASLVIGLLLGTQLPRGGGVVERDGMLVASGALAKGLETQLASAEVGGNDLRILASFRRAAGDLCRAYDAGASAGIACKQGEDWTLERTFAGTARQASEYRQAGSSEADLMRAAQDMAQGEPLDAAQEEAAQAKGWK